MNKLDQLQTCEDCGHVVYLIDGESISPDECPECGSEQYKIRETL